jgi:threonine dehydrogenase-like Zn-dependent dehydrogenase
MGNCNHRKYIPHLIDLVASGVLLPTRVLTQEKPLAEAIDAYHHFDQRESGWLKVALLA